MTQKRVEVHPSHLPRRNAGDLRPFCFSERQRRQHLKWHVRHRRHVLQLESLKLPHHRRQRRRFVLATHEPRIKRSTLRRLRTRVDHLHDIRQRGALAHARAEHLLIAPGREPVLHQPLWSRAERLPPGHAATDDLHEVAQHLTIVHHAVEDVGQQRTVALRQRRSQQGRHVLHVAALTAINRCLRHKLRRHLRGELQRLIELRFRVRVKGRVQRTGHRVLSERLLRRQRISRASRFIPRIRAGQEFSSDSLKERCVCHGRVC